MFYLGVLVATSAIGMGILKRLKMLSSDLLAFHHHLLFILGKGCSSLKIKHESEQ